MIETVDVRGDVFQVDAALRVVTRRGVGYLDGNAHTFPGRFGVWYPEVQDGFATSLSEIDSMTDEAACWIAGFLAASEPSPEQYLGIDHVDADRDVDPTAAEMARWREFTAEFRRSGFCPMLPARPIDPLPITEQLRRQVHLAEWVPWSYAGERVWEQHGSAWLEADPQPRTVHWGLRADTICAQRVHHNRLDDEQDSELGPEWDVCVDCGHVDLTPGATFTTTD